MILPWHIYREAEEDDVEVHFMSMEEQSSISIPNHIGIDPSKFSTISQECTVAVRELGHVNTGSFYNIYATIENRRKLENRADRNAIERYIDKQELKRLMHSGVTQYDRLARHFGFTEDFMKKAVCLYVHGNLAVEHYIL